MTQILGEKRGRERKEEEKEEEEDGEREGGEAESGSTRCWLPAGQLHHKDFCDREIIYVSQGSISVTSYLHTYLYQPHLA